MNDIFQKSMRLYGAFCEELHYNYMVLEQLQKKQEEELL